MEESNFVYNNKKFPFNKMLIKDSILKDFLKLGSGQKETNFFIISEFNNFPDIYAEFIPDFIQLCQKTNIVASDITNSNVMSLNFFSNKYQVHSLFHMTEKHIKDNHYDLINNFLSSEIITNPPNKFEDLLSKYFLEFIKDSRILSLPLPSIYRILCKFYFEKANFDEKLIIDFLVECLIHYGCEISFLEIFRFEDKSYFYDKLNENLDKIDFSSINQNLIFQSIFQKTKKNEINYCNRIEEMEKNYKNQMNEQRLFYEEQIYQLKKTIFDIDLSNFHSENDSFDLFNKLKGESQALVISEIKEKNNNDFYQKVCSLLSFYQKSNKKQSINSIQFNIFKLNQTIQNKVL